MPEHPFGWLSLLPPVVAIVLAIATRRILVSLLSGVAIGALISSLKPLPETILDAVQVPGQFLHEACETHLWGSLIDAGHLRVFAFTMLMGAMVAVIQRSGGMRGVVSALAPLARSRRGGQLITWMLGLIVFFDDYANTLLLGHTMRPLADRLKISREKLAYLVDSTAAPVSGLAIISTWIAGEIGLINSGFSELGLSDSVNGFDIFIETIPYRFYVLLALVFVPLVGLFGRDFGPMFAAERRCLLERHVGEPSAKRVGRTNPKLTDDVHTDRWINAVAPVLLMIAVTVALLLITGWQAIQEKQAFEPTFFNLFSQGDSYVALLYGSFSGLMLAGLLAWSQGILTLAQIRDAAADGARHVLPALAILWLAWSLSNVTREPHLGTGLYLAGILKQSVSVVWMPTLVFVLASCISFATGTSWGTMGILMPLVVQATYQMLTANGAVVSPSDPLMLASIGGVLAGSIFGDHCSPISDTTVLSSQASGCDHVAHVWTQMPYALLVGVVAVVFGTLPVGFGVSPWLLLPIGIVMMTTVLLLIGRRVNDGRQ